MKRLDSKWVCKCGKVVAVHWFSTERGNFIELLEEIRCSRCGALMDSSQTAFFKTSDVDGYLVIWDEVAA